MNCITQKRNCTSRPSKGFTLNFASEQYIEVYMTFLQELECNTGNESVSFTLSEWENGYTLYVFKITDSPIKLDTYCPRSKSATGSARLEVSFAAAVNKTIPVILLYKMLGRIEFDRFNAVVVL